MAGRTRFLILSVCLALTSSGSAFAVPGDLDPTFSEDGKLTTDFTREADYASDVVIQADGKIVAAGRAGGMRGSSGGKFALARYNIDGTLDAAFGDDGKVISDLLPARNDEVAALAIQADGKIVAAGFSGSCCSGSFENGRFGLVRYNPDGTPDTTFSGDGKLTTNLTAGNDFVAGLAVQADGKIVVGGRAGPRGGSFALARYNPNGTLDRTFSRDGRLTTNFTAGNDVVAALRIQSNGKIVAVGWADRISAAGWFALARYNPNGTLDRTFSRDGRITTNFTAGTDRAFGMALQPDGRIVAAGFAGGMGGRFVLARYTTKGRHDRSFGGDGKIATNFTAGHDSASDVMVQSDGKIVAVGSAGSRFALVRYTLSGELDPSFGAGGKLTTDVTSFADYAAAGAIQADRGIVVVGSAGEFFGVDSTFSVVRYVAG